MKLRNKNTGDIWDFDGGITMEATHETAERAGARSGILTCYAASLAELNRDWEDYKPAGPLIKDEKIRKAVRAWAEAESIPPEVTIYYNADEYSLGWHHCEIMFSKHIQGLRDETEYTIAELCGEEDS